MSNQQKILLVEGDADKSFFNRLCNKLSLNTRVKVATPKDSGGNINTKQGVINHLNYLLPMLEDGQYTNIAAVVDGDYIRNDGGPEHTLRLISDVLNEFDYKLREQLPHEMRKGFYFEHSDGLPDFGLWIMPDNREEGMLEDLIKNCISPDESELFQIASESVQQLPNPKFSAHLQTKAEIATWLSWQASPGHGLYAVINYDLLNEECENYQSLCLWLETSFR